MPPLFPLPLYSLSWLRSHPNKFLVGSSYGVLSLCDLGEFTCETEDSSSATSNISSGLYGEKKEEFWVTEPNVVRHYETFEKLTSVHTNSTDQFMLVSGYCHSVKVYDIETGVVLKGFEEIHDDHINISR